MAIRLKNHRAKPSPSAGDRAGLSPRTSFFFARPTRLEGVARMADFAGALSVYNWAPDRVAIAQDWAAVMDELRAAGGKVNAKKA